MLPEVFYEQHREELVTALGRYSGQWDAAREAVQEAFLRALKQRDLTSVMPEKSLWAWLYATAKHALIDELRKNSRTELYDGYDEIDPAGDFTDAVAVRELLYKLPPNLMQIVSLRYFGGLNSAEIGKMKGIPPATVRSQLRAALATLRAYASQK